MKRLKDAFNAKIPPSNSDHQYGYVSMERKEEGNGWESIPSPNPPASYYPHQERTEMPTAGPYSYPPYT